MSSRSIAAAGLLILTVSAAQAQTSHCLFACPFNAPPANTQVNRTIYILSNNPVRKFADWVAYRLNPAFFTGPSRSRNWATDPMLMASDTLAPSDYNDASVALGVDRGHQAPLGSFKGATDWRDTNFLSNITPQFTKLNQGAWQRLEAAIRALAIANPTGQVFVMTGPLYEWPMAKLPDTDKDHRVPSAYWKIVALQDSTGAVTVAGFYFYQDTPKRASYCDHMRTVRFIEEKSGLDFFSGMPDPQEQAFETAQPTLVAGLGC